MVSEYETWKAQQAKQWAESVRRAARHTDSLRAELDALEQSMDGLKGVDYSKDGGGGYVANGDDATASLIIRVDEARRRLMEANGQWVSLVQEFSACCGYLDGRYAQLLRLRYSCGLEWGAVAARMGYNEQYVRGDLHDLALASLYDVMPHRFREPMHPAL